MKMNGNLEALLAGIECNTYQKSLAKKEYEIMKSELFRLKEEQNIKVSSEKEIKDIDNDYELIPLSEITDEARDIAVRWGDVYFDGIAINEKHKLASDIMNYARRYFQKMSSKIVHGEKNIYSDEDIEKAYKCGERNQTFYMKDGTVILPIDYEGIDG